MTINLLALANKLGSGLGGGSLGSRTRTSYQNQLGNLRRGTYIPGTNLKEDEGIRETARKGRKGDTRLRKVGGRVAHVNTTEANAIDKLGPLGEAWVERIGSGTINPSTGLKEYHLWHRHGAHTSFGKFVESGARYIGTGEWQDTATANRERENRNLYGKQYETSGGKQYYTDRLNSMLNKNTAGIQSTALETGGPLGLEEDEEIKPYALPGPPYTSFSNMMDRNFKLTPSSSDYSTFGPKYNTTEEDQVVKEYQNIGNEYNIEFGTGGEESGMSTSGIKKAGIAQTLKDAMGTVGTALKTTASSLSSGLFGLLTQSSQKTGQADFAGQGDFQTEFTQSQLLKDANISFQDAEQERESAQTTAALDKKELQNIEEVALGTRDVAQGGKIEEIKVLQDRYNEAFQTSANNWIIKKYA